MADPQPQLPGKGLFGWLGRQVAHVRKAIRTDVQPTVYQNKSVHEQPHPADPKLLLRRTVIDQAVKRPPTKS